MKIKAVLFDLDGTLLPMDQEVFVKAYFTGLATKLAPCGYDPKQLIDAVWGGTKAMIKNDGTKTNEAVFWDFFTNLYGEKALEDMPHFEEFYKTDFQKVKEICGFEPQVAGLIHKLKAAKMPIVVATSPIFPAIAIESRIKWAGLSPNDFEFYTTYENISYSKPNPEYYAEIARRLNVKPEECLMVGNDVGDDMVAQKIGMQVFLLTDNLINKENADISQFPHGDFTQLSQYIDNILS